MTARAIVIAVETFAGRSDLAALPGVVDAAERFLAWLRETKGVSKDGLVYCASAPVVGGAAASAATAAPTRAAILNELVRVAPAWRDRTDELYVFFAGHGFTYRLRKRQPYLDALVCADYVARGTAGMTCLRLDDLQSLLRFALGPGDHFYFLDGCRDPASPDEVDVPDCGVSLDPSDRGQARIYTLHSAGPGEPAPNDPRFSRLLLDGLRGRGRAKVQIGARFYVTFDRLRGYVERGLDPREIDARTDGGGEGRIVELSGVEPSRCTIEVRRAGAQDDFVLTVLGHPELPPVLFRGPRHHVTLRPDDYDFELKLLNGGSGLVPLVDPSRTPVDLNDAASIAFERPPRPLLYYAPFGVPPPPPPPLPPSRTKLVVLATPGATLRVRGPVDAREATAPFAEDVRPGRYTVELIERGAVVCASSVDVELGRGARVDLRPAHQGPVHAAILAALPAYATHDDQVEFSETLGPTANPDLSVWLAILGASRVLGGDDFSKLVGLGLADLDGLVDEAHGGAYVVSAVPAGELDAVALDGGPGVALEPVARIGAVAQAVLADPRVPGPRQLVFRSGGDEELRLATAVLPGRVTVVTIAPREPDGLAIRQLVLPMKGVQSSAPRALLAPWLDRPLRFVRFSAEAQGRFLARREVGPAPGHDSVWAELLAPRWLDPVMSLVAAYELLRRGQDTRPVLAAMENLGSFFGELPDVEALRRLARLPHRPPRGLPLLLDGAIALGTRVPGFALDHGSGWTVLLATGAGRSAAPSTVAAASASPPSSRKEPHMPSTRLSKLSAALRAEAERKLGLRVTLAPPGLPGAEAFEAAAPPASVERVRELPGVPSFFDEAIVERFGRPSLLVRQGTFEIAAADFWRARLDANRTKLDQVIRSVGRVELVNHRAPWLGTAWMIAPGIAVTNRHVAVEFTDMANGTFEIGKNPLGAPYEIYVNFAAEYLQLEQRRVRVRKVLYVSPLTSAAPDLAFLELEPDPATPPPIPLGPPRSVPPGEKVTIATIGYPAYDYRNDAADQRRIFEDVYGVKRLAPGEIDLVGEDALEHDCTTLGGSSGSVVVDLETGAAVGLHFAGEYLRANYAVTSGVLTRALAERAPAAKPAKPVAPRPSLDAEAAEAPDLAGREGYQPGFLEGFEVPLPDWSAIPDVAPRTDGTKSPLLHYTHYSVLMKADRRIAVFTASNIDGQTAVAIKRKGPEKWYYDPRLAKEHQVGNELYEGNDLDRGHLTRRLDPAWGPREIASAGERETFFWTNCSPQHSQLNQRIWLGLEDYILENAVNRAFKACIFTGPVFGATDPEYRGILLPKAFWKIGAMVNTETGKLSATGYVISQASLISDLEFAYGDYKTFQVPLARIQSLTGLKLPKALLDADPLKGEEAVGGGIRELGSLRDVRV